MTETAGVQGDARAYVLPLLDHALQTLASGHAGSITTLDDGGSTHAGGVQKN